MCAEITVAPVGDAEFDTVTGCSFLDMNDSQISAGSNGGWFSEDTLATCTQNCGAGGSLPSDALMTFVDDRIDIALDRSQLVLNHQRRSAMYPVGSGSAEDVWSLSSCVEVDVVTAQRD